MKLIPLTQGLSATVDDDDYEFLSRWKWCAVRDSKNKNRFYAVRNLPKYVWSRVGIKNQRMIMMHRVVMKLSIFDTLRPDHIDNDGLNNQKENLRVGTQAQNMMSRGIPKNNKSGKTGVSYIKRSSRWRASIGYENKIHYLGEFIDIEDALQARKEAEIKYFGEWRYKGPSE